MFSRCAVSFPLFYNKRCFIVLRIVRETIELSTREREELLDITDRVRRIVEDSGVRNELCAGYAHGTTAAALIQENWDARVPY